MKRTPVDLYEYAGIILRALPKGILLNTSAHGEQDTMTIGWGEMGTDWSLPVFTVFVRDSRHTKKLLDESGEFTLSVPLPAQDVREILGYCGTVSGRDEDKFEKMNLQAVAGQSVGSPAIAQLPLTIECRVIYTQRQDPEAIRPDLHERYYPQPDYHTAYTGQILAAYLLEEEAV